MVSEYESADVDLIQRAIAGDNSALADLFEQYRERLRRMVDLRLDHRVKGRVNASDVLQEAYVDLAGQLKNYDNNAQLPFFIWMRRITGQRLAKTHREHLGAAKRNAALEVSLHRGPMPHATSFALASKLIGKLTSAEDKLVRAERRVKLQEVLNAMDADERELLAMRHFEQLSIAEIAMIQDITEGAAGMRYLRALRRLKKELKQLPDLFDGTFGGESQSGEAFDVSDSSRSTER